MRTARVIILLAAIGQSACNKGSAGPTIPPLDTSSWKFSEGKPELPKDVICLGWPMDENRKVSSSFRDPNHRFTPGKHSGIDFPAPVGTPIKAVIGGKVTKVEPVTETGGAGVSVTFAESWSFTVYHLSRIDVVDGQDVSAGEVLGLSGGAVGAPGSGLYTTGPHLHYSLTFEGSYVNPEQYLCPQP